MPDSAPRPRLGQDTDHRLALRLSGGAAQASFKSAIERKRAYAVAGLLTDGSVA